MYLKLLMDKLLGGGVTPPTVATPWLHVQSSLGGGEGGYILQFVWFHASHVC